MFLRQHKEKAGFLPARDRDDEAGKYYSRCFRAAQSSGTTRGIILAIYIKVSFAVSNHSGLPSERINLSPFTKDFRGGGHLMSLL